MEFLINGGFDNILPYNSMYISDTTTTSSLGLFCDPMISVNITDLGTPSTYGKYGTIYGDPVRGNFSGTYYIQNNNSGPFNVPVNIDVEFIAARTLDN